MDPFWTGFTSIKIYAWDLKKQQYFLAECPAKDFLEYERCSGGMSIWIHRVLIQQRKAEDNIRPRGADIYAREYKNITFCLSAGFCFLLG
jgi:hypothetical protein